jgi:phage shock protein E
MFRRSLLVALVAALSTAACSGSTAPSRAAPVAPGPAAGADAPLAVLAAQPDVLLLDVRRPDEFAAGHVEGAVNVPLGETAQMAALIGRKDRPVILHCRSGNRSGKALAELQAAGFTSLHNAGGYETTARALGRSVVR